MFSWWLVRSTKGHPKPNLKLTNTHQNITNYDYVYIYFSNKKVAKKLKETIEGKVIKNASKVLKT